MINGYQEIVRVAIIGILVVLIALIIASAKFFPSQYETSVEKTVALTLRSYNERGLFRNSLVDDEERKFPITRETFDIGHKTLGEVKKEVAAMTASGRPLEELLTFREFVAEIANAFVKGTPFENRVTVNALPKEGYLNIYFLDADPSKLSSRFEQNCLYTGHLNTIICDTRFFDSLFQRVDQINYLYDLVILQFGKSGLPHQPMFHDYKLRFAQRYLRTTLITWVIGHEIAHALLHKHRVVKEGPLHFNLKYDVVEKEADDYAARKLASDPVLGSRFKPMLGEFIQHELRRIYFSEEYKKPITDPTKMIDLPDKPIEASYSRFDVPLTLRAIQMVLAMYDVNPQINDRASYGIVDADVALVHSLALRSLYDEVANKIAIKESGVTLSSYYYLSLGLGITAILLCFVVSRLRRR